MKAFDFRLDSVLKVQERKKRLAEFRQQQARATLRQREAEVAELRREMDRHADAMAAMFRSGDARSWPALAVLTPRLDGRMRAAETTRLDAEKKLREADERLRQASIAVEVLVELKRKKRQAYDAADAAAEQQRIEEFVLRRWMIDSVETARENVI